MRSLERRLVLLEGEFVSTPAQAGHPHETGKAAGVHKVTDVDVLEVVYQAACVHKVADVDVLEVEYQSAKVHKTADVGVLEVEYQSAGVHKVADVDVLEVVHQAVVPDREAASPGSATGGKHSDDQDYRVAQGSGSHLLPAGCLK